MDDIYSLTGPRFFALASRVSYYEGVMTARVVEFRKQQQVQLEKAGQRGRLSAEGEVTVVNTTQRSYLHDVLT